MEKYLTIEMWRQDVPAWYEIGLIDDRTFRLSIHNAVIPLLTQYLTPEAPINQHIAKTCEVEFASFSPGAWGFESCIRPSGLPVPDWTTYEFALPRQRTTSDAQQRKVWQQNNCLRHTLASLFGALWLFNEETGADRPQLIVVEGMGTGGGMGQSGWTITVSQKLTAWIGSQFAGVSVEAIELGAITQATYTVHDFMYPDKSIKGPSRRYGFSTICRLPNRISLEVPGNACGLYSEPSQTKEGGYQIHSHNVDCFLQQFALLAGIAKLCDLIRTAESPSA